MIEVERWTPWLETGDFERRLPPGAKLTAVGDLLDVYAVATPETLERAARIVELNFPKPRRILSTTTKVSKAGEYEEIETREANRRVKLLSADDILRMAADAPDVVIGRRRKYTIRDSHVSYYLDCVARRRAEGIHVLGYRVEIEILVPLQRQVPGSRDQIYREFLERFGVSSDQLIREPYVIWEDRNGSYSRQLEDFSENDMGRFISVLPKRDNGAYPLTTAGHALHS